MKNWDDELTDPACVPDTFAEGIARIEKIGDECIRMTIYACRQRCGSQPRSQLVVAQIIWTVSAAETACRQWKLFLDNGSFLSAVGAEETTAIN